jgi:hypothetical protein
MSVNPSARVRVPALPTGIAGIEALVSLVVEKKPLKLGWAPRPAYPQGCT